VQELSLLSRLALAVQALRDNLLQPNQKTEEQLPSVRLRRRAEAPAVITAEIREKVFQLQEVVQAVDPMTLMSYPDGPQIFHPHLAGQVLLAPAKQAPILRTRERTWTRAVAVVALKGSPANNHEAYIFLINVLLQAVPEAFALPYGAHPELFRPVSMPNVRDA
jgi:hypothetical protein